MPKPKIRGIVTFIRIECARWEQQIAQTLEALLAARAIVETRGYAVESVRITTQPKS